MNDVLLQKCASIQRYIQRTKEEYANSGDNFEEDYTRQDAAILNLLRACETCIDIANHLCRQNQLGIPASSRDSFDLLCQAQVINTSMANKLKLMTGFRNLAVHNYGKVDVPELERIIQENLGDLEEFTKVVAKQAG